MSILFTCTKVIQVIVKNNKKNSPVFDRHLPVMAVLGRHVDFIYVYQSDISHCKK